MSPPWTLGDVPSRALSGCCTGGCVCVLGGTRPAPPSLPLLCAGGGGSLGPLVPVPGRAGGRWWQSVLSLSLSLSVSLTWLRVQEELSSTSVEHLIINPNAAYEKFRDKRLGTEGVGELGGSGGAGQAGEGPGDPQGAEPPVLCWVTPSSASCRFL